MGTSESDPATTYVCGDIEVLEGIEAIRRRPGMYVGDTRDGSGLRHLVYGLVENAADQHMEGRASRIDVTLSPSGAFVVEDNGPGLPVSTVALGSRRVSVMEILCTTIHGGTRFVPGRREGSFGITLAAASALGASLIVESQRDGAVHRLEISRGKVTTPMRVEPRAGSGTWIKLLPDPAIFGEGKVDARALGDMLRTLTFLTPGLRVTFTRPGLREVFVTRGIDEWVAHLTEGVDAFPACAPLRIRGAHGGVLVDVAMRWTRWPEGRVRGFVNQSEVRVGDHLDALFATLEEAGAPRAGLVAVIDVRGDSVTRTGSCRERLEGGGVYAAVQTIVSRALAERLRAMSTPGWWARLREIQQRREDAASDLTD